MFGKREKTRKALLDFLIGHDKIDEKQLFITGANYRYNDDAIFFGKQIVTVEEKLPVAYVMSLKGEYLHFYALGIKDPLFYKGRINVNRLQFLPKTTRRRDEKVTYDFTLTTVDDEGKTYKEPLHIVCYTKQHMEELIAEIEKIKNQSKQNQQ